MNAAGERSSQAQNDVSGLPAAWRPRDSSEALGQRHGTIEPAPVRFRNRDSPRLGGILEHARNKPVIAAGNRSSCVSPVSCCFFVQLHADALGAVEQPLQMMTPAERVVAWVPASAAKAGITRIGRLRAWRRLRYIATSQLERRFRRAARREAVRSRPRSTRSPTGRPRKPTVASATAALTRMRVPILLAASSLEAVLMMSQ